MHTPAARAQHAPATQSPPGPGGATAPRPHAHAPQPAEQEERQLLLLAFVTSGTATNKSGVRLTRLPLVVPLQYY